MLCQKKKNKFLGLAKPSVCFSKEIPVPTDSGTRADDRQQSPMSLLSSLTAQRCTCGEEAKSNRQHSRFAFKG